MAATVNFTIFSKNIYSMRTIVVAKNSSGIHMHDERSLKIR